MTDANAAIHPSADQDGPASNAASDAATEFTGAPAQPKDAIPTLLQPYAQQLAQSQSQQSQPPQYPAAGTQDPAKAARDALRQVKTEVGKAVVGQDAAVTGLVIALLCQGHVLLEGVPGVAKTLLVRALSAALSLDTKRVQFTPDLMPGDITGSLIYDARTAEFSFRQGPVFTNLLLADEINRTPPKTQAALLEAMEERQVTVDGLPRMLPSPFVVAATQNPLEFEGTYPLPEAQLDRFLLKLILPLPSRDEEIAVLRRHADGFDPRNLAAAGVRPVAGQAELESARTAVRRVTVTPEVLGYIADTVRATRTAPALAVGVSPRGATALLSAARAWAWLSGRDFATPDDVKALAKPVLRHRVRLRPESELEGVSTDSVLDSVLNSVAVPR
jgi:MoxR-like ATPase